MIGLDTNVLVRLLCQDEPVQAAEAARLLEAMEERQEPVYVSVIALCETVWVLTTAYRLSRSRVTEALRDVLQTSAVVVEDDAAVAQALELYARGPGDFSDYLLGLRAKSAGCRAVATFDRALQRDPDIFAAPRSLLRAQRAPRGS